MATAIVLLHDSSDANDLREKSRLRTNFFVLLLFPPGPLPARPEKHPEGAPRPDP